MAVTVSVSSSVSDKERDCEFLDFDLDSDLVGGIVRVPVAA